jgi:hypothetical protein
MPADWNDEACESAALGCAWKAEFSFAPFGAEYPFSQSALGLRRGLHSLAASRLPQFLNFFLADSCMIWRTAVLGRG